MTKKQIRKEFNPEYSENNDKFFTDYELYLEKRLIEMEKEEFKRYMRLQEKEIEKYKWLRSEQEGKDLGNACCQEWIERYAKDFSEKYWRKK